MNYRKIKLSHLFMEHYDIIKLIVNVFCFAFTCKNVPVSPRINFTRAATIKEEPKPCMYIVTVYVNDNLKNKPDKAGINHLLSLQLFQFHNSLFREPHTLRQAVSCRMSPLLCRLGS